METTDIIVGGIVPLYIQLSDGSNDKFCRAKVYDPLNNLLATVPLPVQMAGLYESSSYLMPDLSFIVVQYQVYSDAGYTTLLISGSETIERKDTGDIVIWDGIPTVNDFKAFFVRDFPYGNTLDTVTDQDIVNALSSAYFTFNECFFSDDTSKEIGFLLLAAHYLVISLRTSSQGISGQFAWLAQSKSVGSVSESFAIPQSILDRPMLAMLAQTNYGARYLMMVLPFLTGPIFSSWGGTQA